MHTCSMESAGRGESSGLASTSSFTDTPSVGYEAEDSESESGLVFPLSKRPCLFRSKTCGGRFKKSWDIPFLEPSKKGEKFAYCTLCSRDFSVAHGGLNDATHHCESSGHQKKYSEFKSNSSLTTYFRESSQSHKSRVLAAEVMMAQFVALHDVPFQAADHLTDLFQSMFPDSRIAADFSSTHTKTKAIICDALEPYLKSPIIVSLKSTEFNIMCDKSNDRGDQCKLLTVLVRFFDPKLRQ